MINNKTFVMFAIGVLAFIQAGSFYLGYNGQITAITVGAITYLLGIVTKAGYDKVKKKE